VAIPHADVEHVRRPGLGIALLRRPVRFGEMGGGAASVETRMVVLILVTDPHQQLCLLTALIDVFQRDDWAAAIEQSTDVESFVAMFTALLDHSCGPTVE
jgi:Phosphotransferase system mannitol/fructose-specific IIA domain (Ntr-type)